MNVKFLRQLVKFPSPCGEKVGINVKEVIPSAFGSLAAKFPSPCGEKVGINTRIGLC